MNRRNIIIGSITLAILTLILLAIMFIQPTHTISITFDKKNLSAKIYRNTGKSTSEITSINGSSKIQLSDGKYIIKTSSKSGSINENSTEFTVKGSDENISIKTEYSQKFMSSKINEYRSDISEVLFAKYPELKSSFILQKEIILGNNADWYAASYQRGVIDRNSDDVYTVILKKEDNKWVIKTKPQIINTIYNTKDIPEDILSETASRLSPFSANS